jgi:hypothetical protein
MRFKIRQCIELKSLKSGKNIRYGIGTRDIPDEDCTGWFFDALVNSGKLELLEDKKPAPLVEDVAIPEVMAPFVAATRRKKKASVEEMPAEEAVEESKDSDSI